MSPGTSQIFTSVFVFFYWKRNYLLDKNQKQTWFSLPSHNWYPIDSGRNYLLFVITLDFAPLPTQWSSTAGCSAAGECRNTSVFWGMYSVPSAPISREISWSWREQQQLSQFNPICAGRYLVKHTLDLLDEIGLGAMEKLNQLVTRNFKASISTVFFIRPPCWRRSRVHKNLQFYCLNSTNGDREPFKCLLNLFILGINTNSSNRHLVVKAKGGAAQISALNILHYFRLSEARNKSII